MQSLLRLVNGSGKYRSSWRNCSRFEVSRKQKAEGRKLGRTKVHVTARKKWAFSNQLTADSFIMRQPRTSNFELLPRIFNTQNETPSLAVQRVSNYISLFNGCLASRRGNACNFFDCFT